MTFPNDKIKLAYKAKNIRSVKEIQFLTTPKTLSYIVHARQLSITKSPLTPSNVTTEEYAYGGN